MDKVVAEIESMKARWMTGGAAAGLGPGDWQEMDELALLALAGQFTRIAMRPATASGTTLRPDIPDLGLPPMPEALRPQFRRILDSKLAEAPQVVRLITARGYCVNPIDWMPKRNDTDLPPIYETWRDWLDGNLPAQHKDGLTAETWDAFAPGQRYQELTRLHRDTPEAARALIAEIAPALAAEQRLRMLQCLRPALTQGDADLLDGFVNDRSSKVQALIKTQLARLGTGPETDAEALAELTDYVELAKAGLLSRKRVVKPRKLKNKAQRQRRAMVFAKVSLAAFAEVLGISPDEAIDTWAFGDGTDDFMAMVGASATDVQVLRLTERAMAEQIHTAPPLMDRLDAEMRLEIGLRLLKDDEFGLPRVQEWITAPEGNVDWATISRIKHIPKLSASIVEPQSPRDEGLATQSLAFLGLLSDREAAARLLETLTTAGVMAVDPRLTLLRLNAAL